MKRFTYFLIVSCITLGSLNAQNEARLLRFPTIHKDQITFSYGGDLYSVNAAGGLARKLTTHNGYEMFPKFSPDGKYIAFTGQYDGNTEVFLIPSTGGVPERLTYTATLGRDDIGDRMGPNNIVMGWTPDGKDIIFRSRNQSFNPFKGQLFKVSKEGGMPRELPLTDGGFCSYSPDGTQLAFNWVFREFRTWKYYKGGMTDDIRIFDFKSKTATKITDHLAQDIIPMWIGDEIYFLSDRDRTMNLFVYNTKTQATTKVTDFVDYDIKFPSHSRDAIVFEKGGYIYLFDPKSKEAEKVNISIADDHIFARNEIKDVSMQINVADLSPNGERVIFGARGEIFNLPAKNGVTKNMTRTPGIHELNADWSPDGNYIAYLSDQTGEYELYMMKHDGSENPVQLTQNSSSYILGYEWSPDSKKILYIDKKQQLKYVDIESGKVTIVDESERSPFFSFNWSPDSKWIAFTKPQKDMTRIRLYDVAKGESYEVTEGWYNSVNPSFSSDGKYLIFVSARDFNPFYSQTEWNHAYTDMSKIYLVTLSKDTPSPFALVDDKVELNPSDDESNGDKSADKSITVDIEGIQDRVISLPVRASNYFNVVGIKDKLYYMERSSASRGGTQTKMFDLKKKKETELAGGIQYVFSSSGKKMLVRQNGKWGVINTPSGKIMLDESIDQSGMKVYVDYKKEWQQMFREAWRYYRDYFYASNMHGVEWESIFDKYSVLVPYVAHRSDLTYLMGEMVGELSTGHCYINNGSRPMPKRIQTGLLGAKISRDASSGYFRIDKILKGANWSSSLRSPLTEIGLNVKDGDFILAVDGINTKNWSNIFTDLTGKANTEVELTINSRPGMDGSRKILVKPISDESNLYYYNWVQDNIAYVNKTTDGKVGYIHIPDMGPSGLNEFVKHFYPQLTKKGLIIDVRGNGGGNVSPMIIERLLRQMTYATMSTGMKEGNTNPTGMHLGPKVTLLDKYSASDGDLFPYRFQVREIGPTIGTRSWGGVVGYSGSLPFIDGGSVIVPSYAPFAKDGSGFIIEGEGVTPDIIVENDPYQLYQGQDDQLDKAIEVILGEIKNYKGNIPPIPPFPDKSGNKEK